MLRLTLILHAFVGSTLAGIGVIAVLVAGMDTVPMILGSAVLGFLLGFPASYVVAKRIT